MTTETRDAAMLERLARGRATAAANRKARQQEAVTATIAPAGPRPMVPPTPASKAYQPTPTDIFIEQFGNQSEERQERAVDGEGGVTTTTHTGATLVLLYFPTSWGWESREVPSTNVRMCIREGGAKYACGDCGGNCSPDPRNPLFNNCPGRPKFATMQCPVCGRLAYDFDSRNVNADLLQPVNELRSGESDGTLIADPNIASLTPAMRLTTLNAQHMRRYHPDVAEAMGLGRERQDNG